MPKRVESFRGRGLLQEFPCGFSWFVLPEVNPNPNQLRPAMTNPLSTFAFSTTLCSLAFAASAHAQIGPFTAHPSPPNQPYDVELADHDGDGDRDVWATDNAGALVHWVNNPAGTFPAVATLGFVSAPGQRPVHIAVGRLDANVADDLSVCETGANPGVALYHHPSATVTSLPAPSGLIPEASTVLDLNNDGLEDVAVVAFDPASLVGAVYIVRQTSPGTYVVQTGTFPVGLGPTDIVNGRFDDADNRPDLCTANQASSSISYLINTSAVGGVITFAPQAAFPFPQQRPDALTAVDIDCNGLDDVAGVTRGFAAGTCFFSMGPGLTVNPVTFALAGFGARDIYHGNEDCRGGHDLLISRGGTPAVVDVVRHNGGLTFQPPIANPGSTQATRARLAVGDVTGDGTADAVMLHDSISALSIFRNRCSTCCHEYCDGIADNFASPSPVVEPACPCPPLVAWATPPLEPNFDSPASNRRFIHSIKQLPANILSAELTIRCRSNGGGSGNDAISLALNPGGPTAFLWGGFLADRPESGGTWNGGDTATFVFDLANMSNGFNLIPALNCGNCLDIYVQDDTSVDFVELKIKAGARSNCDLDLAIDPIITNGSIANFTITGAPLGDVLAGTFVTLAGPGPGPVFLTQSMCVGTSASLLYLATPAPSITNSIFVPNLTFPPCLQLTSQAFSLPSESFSQVKTQQIF